MLAVYLDRFAGRWVQEVIQSSHERVDHIKRSLLAEWPLVISPRNLPLPEGVFEQVLDDARDMCERWADRGEDDEPAMADWIRHFLGGGEVFPY